ncbi:MAG TPA: hypothetical protein DEF47_01810 [Herpetosiphon sp.]|nr:hypothetical protein [Herpetosiphon sp.]
MAHAFRAFTRTQGFLHVPISRRRPQTNRIAERWCGQGWMAIIADTGTIGLHERLPAEKLEVYNPTRLAQSEIAVAQSHFGNGIVGQSNAVG